MKSTDLSKFTLGAIAMTGGRAEYKNRELPTWDGSCWHFARLACEEDVLHEVAHWLVSKPEHRRLPNYGLGQDPDDGPIVDPSDTILAPGHLPRELAPDLRLLARTAPAALQQLFGEKFDREESVAAVVTIALIRDAGLPWAARMRRLLPPDRAGEFFWRLVHEVSQRGIDLHHPLVESRGMLCANP